MHPVKRAIAGAAIFATAMCHQLVDAAPAAAQAFPSKSIRLLVGFPPGGGADSVARIIGDEMSRSLGQPVIVENKPGATGALVVGDLGKADPDGHVLLVTPSSLAVFTAMAKTAPLDDAGSFIWVANVIDMPFYILVHDDSEVKSLADLVAKAKAAPGTLSFGSAGIGSAYHLLVELIGLSTGAKFVHVPYRGDAPLVTDLLGKHIQFAPTTPTGLAGNLEKGRLRALAVTTGKRWPAQPTIPTVAEALDFKDFDIGTWFAVAGPPRMPRETVVRINAEIARAAATTGVRSRLDALGGQVNLLAPDQLQQRAAREFAVLGSIADRIGLPR